MRHPFRIRSKFRDTSVRTGRPVLEMDQLNMSMNTCRRGERSFTNVTGMTLLRADTMTLFHVGLQYRCLHEGGRAPGTLPEITISSLFVNIARMPA